MTTDKGFKYKIKYYLSVIFFSLMMTLFIIPLLSITTLFFHIVANQPILMVLISTIVGFILLFLYVQSEGSIARENKLNKSFIFYNTKIAEFFQSYFPSNSIPFHTMYLIYKTLIGYDGSFRVYSAVLKQAISLFFIKGSINSDITDVNKLSNLVLHLSDENYDITSMDLSDVELLCSTIHKIKKRSNIELIPLQQIYFQYKKETNSTIDYETFYHRFKIYEQNGMIGGEIKKSKTTKNPFDDFFIITTNEFDCVVCKEVKSMLELPYQCPNCSRYICKTCCKTVQRVKGNRCPYCKTKVSSFRKVKLTKGDDGKTSLEQKWIDILSKIAKLIDFLVFDQIIDNFWNEGQNTRLSISDIFQYYKVRSNSDIDISTFYVYLIVYLNKNHSDAKINHANNSLYLKNHELILSSEYKKEFVLDSIQSFPNDLRIDLAIFQSVLEGLKNSQTEIKVSLTKLHQIYQKQTDDILPFLEFYEDVEKLVKDNSISGQIDTRLKNEKDKHRLILIRSDSFICDLCGSKFNLASLHIRCNFCNSRICLECKKALEKVGYLKCNSCGKSF